MIMSVASDVTFNISVMALCHDMYTKDSQLFSYPTVHVHSCENTSANSQLNGQLLIIAVVYLYR